MSTTLDQVTARDVMQTDVVTVSTTTTLADVERTLSDYRIGGVPVTDEAGHIVGVVSMRDLLERYAEDPVKRGQWHGFYDEPAAASAGTVPSLQIPEHVEETAGDIMTGQVHCVESDATLAAVARQMVDHQVHRLLVEEGGKHVGLVTTFDLLRALGRN